MSYVIAKQPERHLNRYFFLFAAVVSVSAPAFARVVPEHFSGGLTSDTPVRLQRAAVYFQEGGPGFADVPVEQLGREQLQLEYQRLDREKPSIGGPIALTAVGGGLLLFGIIFFAYSVFGYVFGIFMSDALVAVGYVLLGFAAALGITGAVLLTVGLVKMFTRIGQRRAYSQRMDDINARLESLDRSGSPPPPPPPDSLPPPPPPPGAGFFDVKPSLVLATF